MIKFSRTFTYEYIQSRLSSASFQKGTSYFNRGTIFETRLQGQTLKAQCRGSQADSYKLQITFGSAGIVSASCSCPVGNGGRCKHIAALLLKWIDTPDSFIEIEDLKEALAKRNKTELIDLIKLMIQREPDLEIFLEMPLPGRGAHEKQLDAQIVRRQVINAFRNPDGDWEMGWADPYEVVNELQSLFDLAGQYQDQNSSDNASTIYRTIAETVLEYEDAIKQDEDGQLGSAIDDCAEGLGECLVSCTDGVQRERILKGLLDIYIWDLKAGGIGIGEHVPDILLEQATSQEQSMIFTWVELALDGMNDWARHSLGRLLLTLQADVLDDESYLRVCRQTGRLEDLVDRLLTMKHIDDAAEEAKQADDYILLSLADLFVQHDHGSRAQTLILDRAKTSQDIRLTEWLKNNAKKFGDLIQALAYAEKLFCRQLSVASYLEMRQLAQPQQWTDLYAQTLECLVQKQNHILLTEIFLEEGKIDQALASLEQAKASNRFWGGFTLQVKVAKAASEQKPKESIQLYLQLAENLILQHGRNNYVQAVGYLQLIRETFLRLDEPQSWLSLITNLREKYRNLPALRDELYRAGL